MRGYPVPANELERIQALDSFALMDSPPERDYDQIVQMAARIFNAEIALVSLLHRDRQFFKASVGVDFCETSREISFCTHAILGENVFYVLNAATDERFRTNDLVREAPHVRFYAGAPLITSGGYALGTLCLLDTSPREVFSERDQLILKDLANLVLERMELRRLEQRNREIRMRFMHITSTSPDAIICADSKNQIISWNSSAESIFGHTAEEAIGQTLDLIIPKGMRARHISGFNKVVSGGQERIIGTSVNLTALHRDGHEIPIELSLSRWTEGGEAQFGAIIRDITSRVEAEKLLKHAAENDHLTGLANRSLLKRHLQEVCSSNMNAAILLIDLDGFKEINDTLGHAAGDFVLQVTSQRIRQHVPACHLVARLGGDEFVVLMSGSADQTEAVELGFALVALIEEPVEFDDNSIYIGASIGVSMKTDNDMDSEQILGNADLALYQAKADGRCLVRVFTPELRQTASRKGTLNSSLRQAWENKEFEMYYQPQVQLRDGSISGAEALIRWNHPTHGVVSPAFFLNVLETSLLAIPVGEWILRTACEQAAKWRSAGHPGFRIGINLFAAQFRVRDFSEVVERALNDFALPPSALELEITENIILRNELRIMQPLHHLRSLGVGIAFDDFGTGYASLSLLKDYPVTRLKIDRSFVSGAERSEKDQVIIETVIRLAAGFNLEVTAEGIETQEQEDLMRRYACNEGQGYLYGQPMTASEFTQLYISECPGVL
ncbi:diguanylate phosphodiesterase [Robbsia andropogonis]|uniref:Diguanylate phosphodiesterase n=1 Tax=Robbsia andropogonis TaxID=28092 RepID=A0A0F5JW43_9BURK|nr:EAL domain-containing protein [Robbsia andropogonis]KKB61920.1 diguanylate phosphodiesterase [Robbsia andropogonis]